MARRRHVRPGFFTGSLIKRFGALAIIVTGAVIMAAGALVALNGDTIAHFVAALLLVGFGWNFLYTGGTTLLRRRTRPPRKHGRRGPTT